MSKINISEIFGPTCQGEGKRAGRLCMFIRTNGCNLRCQFLNPDGKTYTPCDTAYTSWDPEKANMMEVRDIVHQVIDVIKESGHRCKDIVITGGEPFLHKGVVELIDVLVGFGYYITVETNGTIYRKSKAQLISMSPKLKTSIPFLKDSMERSLHIKNRVFKNSVPQFQEHSKDIQYKFVYSNESDVEEIIEFIEKYNICRTKVYLMPQGLDLKTQLEHTTKCMDIAIKNGFNFTSRLHILAYGDKRGV